MRSMYVTALLILSSVLSMSAAQGEPEGANVYATSCASCHQPNGAGIPGVFPPIAGHVGDLYAAENGRQYLSDVIVFGLQGAITIDGTEYDGVMPSWFHLSDEEIAAVLNHIMTAWDDPVEFEPYDAADVARSRRAALSPQGVLERRPNLGDDAVGDTVELPLASFTVAQVERARPVYGRLCAECHGDSFTGGLIGGPPLRGAIFLQRWGGRSVAPLFAYTVSQMPQGNPGGLSGRQYADLIALILDANGHEPGDVELSSDPSELERVRVRGP
jgi:mono/diheme cytochrome c family protein